MTARPTSDGAVPLSAPYYGTTARTFPSRSAVSGKKYATFTGRASRSEYWWWEVAQFIVAAVLMAICIPSLLAGRTGGHGIQIGAGIVIVIVVGSIWGLATIVPNTGLTWRRLHDANLSGLFWLLAFIPSVGGIIVLVLTLLPSKPEGARFDTPAK